MRGGKRRVPPGHPSIHGRLSRGTHFAYPSMYCLKLSGYRIMFFEGFSHFSGIGAMGHMRSRRRVGARRLTGGGCSFRSGLPLHKTCNSRRTGPSAAWRGTRWVIGAHCAMSPQGRIICIALTGPSKGPTLPPISSRPGCTPPRAWWTIPFDGRIRAGAALPWLIWLFMMSTWAPLPLTALSTP